MPMMSGFCTPHTIVVDHTLKVNIFVSIAVALAFLPVRSKNYGRRDLMLPTNLFDQRASPSSKFDWILERMTFWRFCQSRNSMYVRTNQSTHNIAVMGSVLPKWAPVKIKVVAAELQSSPIVSGGGDLSTSWPGIWKFATSFQTCTMSTVVITVDNHHRILIPSFGAILGNLITIILMFVPVARIKKWIASSRRTGVIAPVRC